MDLIYSKTHSDFQDYSIISIYQLSFSQKDTLLEEIYKTSCNFGFEKPKKNCLNWKKCEDYYFYEYLNKEEDLKISIDLIARNNLSLLTIYEVKY